MSLWEHADKLLEANLDDITPLSSCSVTCTEEQAGRRERVERRRGGVRKEEERREEKR